MDQNSSNGAGSAKASWRERLKIGTNRDMPRLADEFDAPEPEAAVAPAKPAAPRAAAPRAPQAVTRPAPMAPRAAPARQAAAAPVEAPPARAESRPASRSNPQVAQAPRPAPAPAPVTPAARLPEAEDPPLVAAPDSLVEKLRAQRAAAERLAQQRVSAARERAEAKTAASAPAPVPPPVASRPPQAAPAPVGPRPKFSFADDGNEPPMEPAPRATLQPPPAVGPKPAIRPVPAGNRFGPSLLRNQPPQPQPSFRPEPPPYRPIDPATGYPGGASRGGGLGGMRPSYAGDAPQVGQRPLPRQQAAYDSYRRAAEPPLAAPQPDEEPAYEEQRPEPRLGRPVPPLAAPARPNARRPQPAQDDVFADDPAPAPRRRATATDYQAAQREVDFEEEDTRRSIGPWLLLVVVLAAGLATAGGVWWYNNHVKPASGLATTTVPQGGTQTGTSTVPVVPAPSQPPKTNADAGTQAGGTQAAPAATKKQIYDRIVGDQEVPGNKVQPTEVTPVQPDTQTVAPSQQGASEIPQPAGAAPDPQAAPAAQAPAGIQDNGADPAAPLPLPPPPGDNSGKAGTQGSLTAPATQQVAELQQAGAAAGKSAQDAAGAAATAAQEAVVPAAASPPAPSVGAADQTQASPPSPAKPAASATDNTAVPTIGETDANAAAAKPASPKPAAAAKPASDSATRAASLKKTASALSSKNVLKKKSASQTAAATPSVSGAKPLVLVPPSQAPSGGSAQGFDASSTAAPSQGGTLPAVAAAPSQPAVAAPAHKKTIFDLFKGSNSDSAGAADVAAPAPQPQVAQPQTRMAAIPAPNKTQATAPAAPAASGGGGYVVQLSSFGSQGEAQSEYGRLRSKYPSVVGGLAPRISQAAVGGSNRYQLGLGPMSSRDQATQVCSSLFAQGERDCLVRKQ